MTSPFQRQVRNTQLTTHIHARGGIRNRNLSKRTAANLLSWTQKGNSSALIGLLGKQDAGWHCLPRTEGPRSTVITIRTTAFIQKLRKLRKLYTLCGSQNKQWLFPYTALADQFLQWTRGGLL
jgi:hypothetical protein